MWISNESRIICPGASDSQTGEGGEGVGVQNYENYFSHHFVGGFPRLGDWEPATSSSRQWTIKPECHTKSIISF